MTSIESSANKIRPSAVFDANVLISAAISGIHAAYSLALVEGRAVDGYTSLPILSDVRRKLTKKLRLSEERIDFFLNYLGKHLTIVSPVTLLVPQLRDQRDLHVLGTAVAAEADLIITTDRDLLTLKSFRSIGIVHPKTLSWIFPLS